MSGYPAEKNQWVRNDKNSLSNRGQLEFSDQPKFKVTLIMIVF